MIKNVKINGAIFQLDMRYNLIMEIVSPEYKQEAEDMDFLYGRADEMLKRRLAILVKEGCGDDVAMSFFVMMLMQNYGERIKALEFIESVYRRDTTNILARCAYATALFFNEKVKDIPAVFEHIFDIDKTTTQRAMPLITFVQYVKLACEYYWIVGDFKNTKKYLDMLTAAAPEHDITQRLERNFIHECQQHIDALKNVH